MNKLLLIEGIPGSGKTTIALRLKEYLEAQGKNVKVFQEGDSHPVDMAWNAYMTVEEYESLIQNNKHHEPDIKQNTIIEDGFAIVAYTKLNLTRDDIKLKKLFEEHEVYDGKTSLEVFKKLHFNRWKAFGHGAKKDEIVIFECSFLQNHINELMAFHLKDNEYILNYLQELIGLVAELNPKLIYLKQCSVRETIGRVAKQRLSPDKSLWEDWIDMVIRYIENSNYGKKQMLRGYDGTITFFEDRIKLESEIIKQLPIDKVIIENINFDWDHIFKQVKASI